MCMVNWVVGKLLLDIMVHLQPLKHLCGILNAKITKPFIHKIIFQLLVLQGNVKTVI